MKPRSQQEKKISLFDLFFTFFKLGLFTFGGGYAMIANIRDIVLEKKKWLTEDELIQVITIAESTPGPIAINLATYVGYQKRGVAGSACATLGVVLPSFVIIYLISSVLDNFLEILWVANAFRGIKIGVGLVILRVAVNMLQKMPKKPFPRIVAGCAFAVMSAVNFLSLKFSSISLMILAGLVSLGIHLTKRASNTEGGEP